MAKEEEQSEKKEDSQEQENNSKEEAESQQNTSDSEEEIKKENNNKSEKKHKSHKKAKHEKHNEKKHAPDHNKAVYHKKKVKFSKNAIWKIATLILAILLIISIFTQGFRTGISIDRKEDVETDELTLTVLNDERCEDCMMEGESLIMQLESIFPNIEVKRIDYGDNAGKELYESTNTVHLPAIFFSGPIEQEPGYPNIQQFLVQRGNYLSLNIGASFNPTKEICDNGIDDTGNGLIDCEDPDCVNTLICNPDMFAECVVEQGLTPETIIFYYSMTCPFCTMMIPAIEQLEEEGYDFKWVEAGDMQDEIIIDACFRDYMQGGVPQFICPKTTEIRPGAFMDRTTNDADLDALRAWADNCIEG